MPVYKLKLCYDGSRYNGWQKQGNTGNTIQETLEGALSDVFGQSVDAAGSGRTDAGVSRKAVLPGQDLRLPGVEFKGALRI